MGNWFAFTMLFLWPLLSIRLYYTKSVQAATFWTLVGGVMFLPVRTEIDLPMFPSLNKTTIPIFSVIIGCWLKNKRWLVFSRKDIKYLFILYLISPFITAALNGDNIVVGGLILPGISYYDGFSSFLERFILISPLFIGRALFATYNDQVFLFKSLVLASLLYSLFILFEIRMSPQLHYWVYGFFPHQFAQMVRYGGFRPVVFMGHGLWVSFFVVITLTAALGLHKVRFRFRFRFRKDLFSINFIVYYLLFILVLCKSIASAFYGVFVFILIKMFRVKNQLRVALIMVMVALVYPVLCITEIFPHQAVVEWVSEWDEQRAQSLGVRFNNEAKLLKHTQQKSLAGWGGWGRNRVYNKESGKDETTTDGGWIITFSEFGWIGFIAEFGLIAIAVFRAVSVEKIIKSSQKEMILLGAHTIMVSLIMIDQLPNASLVPWLWFVIGVLLGRTENIMQKDMPKKQRISALK